MNRIFRISITGIFLTALRPFTVLWKVFSLNVYLEKIQSEKLHDLNSLTDFIRLAKSRNWRWPGRVPHRREMRALLWL